MNDLTLGRLRVSAVVERAGPTRPTWLLPDATAEALERHREWRAPHFLDDRGRLLQSIHAFVVRAPGLTALVDTWSRYAHPTDLDPTGRVNELLGEVRDTGEAVAPSARGAVPDH